MLLVRAAQVLLEELPAPLKKQLAQGPEQDLTAGREAELDLLVAVPKVRVPVPRVTDWGLVSREE